MAQLSRQSFCNDGKADVGNIIRYNRLFEETGTRMFIVPALHVNS
jgi:hypothetical protein